MKCIILDDSTFIVRDGQIEPGAPDVNIATVNFLARGGDQYPFGGADFTILGVTYQQALANYLVQALNGVVTELAYPADTVLRNFRVDASFSCSALVSNEELAEAGFTFVAYPNPAREQITFDYFLPEAAQVRVELLNLMGSRVALLQEGRQAAGSHQLQTTLGDLAAGMYLLRMQVDNQTVVQRLNVLR